MLRCYRSSCNFQHALDATLLPSFVCFSNTHLMLRCYRFPCHFYHALDSTDTLDATLLPFFLQLPTRSWFDAATVLRTKIHTQQFILSQAQFVAVLQKLAMEVHKPSCQLAEKTLKTLKRIFCEKAAGWQALHEPMKWAGTMVRRENVQTIDR